MTILSTQLHCAHTDMRALLHCVSSPYLACITGVEGETSTLTSACLVRAKGQTGSPCMGEAGGCVAECKSARRATPSLLCLAQEAAAITFETSRQIGHTGQAYNQQSDWPQTVGTHGPGKHVQGRCTVTECGSLPITLPAAGHGAWLSLACHSGIQHWSVRASLTAWLQFVVWGATPMSPAVESMEAKHNSLPMRQP